MKSFRAGAFFILTFAVFRANAISLRGICDSITAHYRHEKIKRDQLVRKQKLAHAFVQFQLSEKERELYSVLFHKVSQKAKNAGEHSEFLIRVIDDFDFSKVDGSAESLILALANGIAEKKDKLYVAQDVEIKPIISELFKENPVKAVNILTQMYFHIHASLPRTIDQKQAAIAYQNIVSSEKVQKIIAGIEQDPALSAKEKKARKKILSMEIEQSLAAEFSIPMLGEPWNIRVAKDLNEWGEVIPQADKLSKIEFKKPVAAKTFVFETPYYLISDQKAHVNKNKTKHTSIIVNNLKKIYCIKSNSLMKKNGELNDIKKLNDYLVLLGADGSESEEELKKRSQRLIKKNALIWSPDKGKDESDRKYREEQMKSCADAPNWIARVCESNHRLRTADGRVAEHDKLIKQISEDSELSNYFWEWTAGFSKKLHPSKRSLFSQQWHTLSNYSEELKERSFDKQLERDDKYIKNDLSKKYVNDSLLPLPEEFTYSELEQLSNKELIAVFRRNIRHANLGGAIGPQSKEETTAHIKDSEFRQGLD